MENGRVGRVRVSESDARSRGAYRSMVECHSLQKSRVPREPLSGLIEEIIRALRAHPGNVWCFSGTGEEVSALDSVFRSKRWKGQFSVKTRASRTELYVSLRAGGGSQ